MHVANRLPTRSLASQNISRPPRRVLLAALAALAVLGLAPANSRAQSDLPAFFNGSSSLGGSVSYLAFPNGNFFGYYSDLGGSYIYHFDLGYEYVFDANDGKSGVYLYDFATDSFFYTSPSFSFPYLYSFYADSVFYYYPNTSNPGHYTSKPRYFYDFNVDEIVTFPGSLVVLP